MNTTTSHHSIACLLCGHTETRILQRLDATRLIDAYRSEFGVAITLPVNEVLYLECSHCGLLFFSPALTGDEAFYGELQKISWYYKADKAEFRIAAAYVRDIHDVLEIGAGRGLFTQEIAPASYTGLEFSPVAIRLAAERGIRLLSQTIEQHALENANRYDIACAFQVLEHVAAPRGFIDSAASCLKPGGRLLLSVPGEDSFAAHAYWDVLNMPPHHVTRWRDRTLRSIARICGLELVDVRPEPLGRSARGSYARSMASYWVARRLGLQPQLIDPRLKAQWFGLLARPAASILRGYLSLSSGARRGHAVLAIFEKL